ncbi:MAG: 30S ribosomal protein S6 [candidate division Zixibacteria bacterium]|nr:30S ribosomal protein S6 [candidate division Zixibacteria bacterium]
MRLYETTFITDAQFSESEIETEIKKVEELITSNGGEIVETQRWGIRRLAYEIKHKRQGFYTHFLYRASPSMPPLIENAFKLNERVVRFLTVVSEIDLEARREQAEALAAAAAQITIPPAQSMDRG